MATATPQRPAVKADVMPLVELQHLADPLDGAFMRLAVEHGDKVSTLADYPEFAARFTTAEEADRG